MEKTLVSDEELILSARSGCERAKDVLDVRFCRGYTKHAACVCPDIFRFISHGEIASAAFSTYLKCYDSYEPGVGSFFAYYEAALKHALGRLKEEFFEKGGSSLSLDTSFRCEDPQAVYEVIKSDASEDPRCLLNRSEEMGRLGNAQRYMSEESLEVGRLKMEGLSMSQIAERLCITKKMAWSRYSKFQSVLKSLLSNQYVQEEDGETRRGQSSSVFFSRRRKIREIEEPKALVRFPIRNSKPDCSTKYFS